MCSHEMAPAPGGKTAAPFHAAHLFAGDSAPVCATVATPLELPTIPKGYVVACMKCLGHSEVPL